MVILLKSLKNKNIIVVGRLPSCGCSEEVRPSSIKEDWAWTGCGDNVDYGYRFSKYFFDKIFFPKHSIFSSCFMSNLPNLMWCLTLVKVAGKVGKWKSSTHLNSRFFVTHSSPWFD